jgi:hypothetical protein
MANKPRTPRQFTELVQRLMRADKVTQFLDQDMTETDPRPAEPEPVKTDDVVANEAPEAKTDAPSPSDPAASSATSGEQPATLPPQPAAPTPPSEQPATASPPSEQPTPPPRQQTRHSGPTPKYPREPLWQLHEEDRERTYKELAKLYEAKTGFQVSETWVRTNRVRPRS